MQKRKKVEFEVLPEKMKIEVKKIKKKKVDISSIVKTLTNIQW